MADEKSIKSYDIMRSHGSTYLWMMPETLSSTVSYIQKNLSIAILICFFHLSCALSAQRPVYDIDATIDTIQHTLKGTINISYTNTSDTDLDSLGIHLWSNAFSTKNSALVQQMLHLGNLSLYRSREEDKGGLSDLRFTASDRQVVLKTDPQNIDIGWLILNTPLYPGSTIHLSSPYTLKIPKSFSRPGRTGSSYQLTQWYPHIAVFDELGWHTMPYLDQGEYFNDFADYNVTIRTPSSYSIAATGTLESTTKVGHLTERKYSASNVIDFAWFTSPSFRHEQKLIDVGRSEKVELNVFVESVLNEDWDKAMMYAERAMKFYSEWIGPYPYSQMTVVYTPFSKAGYMEYPMVAQISYTDDPAFLDRVIAHEIGHTWLYGILASDERDHPWMDEGFNTFMENQYMRANYTDPTEIALPRVLHSSKSMDHYDAMLHWARFRRTLQPPESHPAWQSNEQYLFSAYMLPAKGLDMMLLQQGPDMMKQMLHDYFEDYQFRHVSPHDVQSSFEKTCACDLSWFFDEWIHHAHEADYRITKFRPGTNEVTIKNHASSPLPLLLSDYRDGQLLDHQLFDGFLQSQTLTLKENADEVRLFDGMSPNKIWQADARPRKFLPHIFLVPKIGNYTRPSLSITPMFGYNLADGFMPGLTIMSDILPQPRFKFLLMPLYAFDSKEFRYFADARYTSDVNFASFDKLMLSFTGSSFGYNIDTHYVFRDHFVRLAPSVALRMKASSPHSHVTKWWKYRYVDISQYYGQGIDFDEGIYSEEKRHYGVHELAFQMSSDTVLMPYTATANVQAGDGFVRLNLHYKQHFTGKDKMRGIWVHGFAGFLPVFKQPKASVLFSFNGTASNGFFSKDYMFDEWLIGRNAVDGNFTRQVFMKDAGLKTLSTIGISEKWMLGAGASAALPFKVVHFYMDAALYNSGITEKVALSYSGGLAIVLMKDAFEIYIPLIESRDIRNSLTYQVRDQWFDRISFQANFKFANPLYLVDQWQLKY